MDIATILGIVVFGGLVVLTVFMGEGIAGFKPFLNIEAFFIVMGGTFCALLVNYTVGQILNVGRVLRKVLITASDDEYGEIISVFVQMTTKAKKDGFLSLETDIKRIKNDFLKRGLLLVLDGQDQDFIRNMLETELSFIRERHTVGQDIFNALGTYSPAFGIIGTVLGMILMLNSISDVEEVPRRMALALAAAFYGLGAGYVIFLPMAGKLKRKSEEELLLKEIIIRGVLLLHSGSTPSVMESNLKAYIEPAKRLLVKAAPRATPKTTE
ncbi:MAG: MotA/TolQ/ExbB proton channel family protein [Elusimicrobiota bacterium]